MKQILSKKDLNYLGTTYTLDMSKAKDFVWDIEGTIDALKRAKKHILNNDPKEAYIYLRSVVESTDFVMSRLVKK